MTGKTIDAYFLETSIVHAHLELLSSEEGVYWPALTPIIMK